MSVQCQIVPSWNCACCQILLLSLNSTLSGLIEDLVCLTYQFSVHLCHTLQLCPTLCDPLDGSPPGSSVPGFSRQEHWSGFLFPSPMHESEKWKGCHSVLSICSGPQGLQPTRLLRPCDFPGKSTGVRCHQLHIYIYIYIYAAKSLQSCPTLCDPVDGSPAGSPVPGILQARTLERVAFSFSNARKW